MNRDVVFKYAAYYVVVALVAVLAAVWGTLNWAPPPEATYDAAFSTAVERAVTPGAKPEPFKFPNYRDGQPDIGDEFVLRVGKKEGCGEADTHCKVLLFLHKR